MRRTLSHSLHEIAAILGCQVTESQLLVTFDAFMKDIDEVLLSSLYLLFQVKVGVISHIAEFFFVLSPEKRKTYLRLLVDIQADKAWRFRKLIAK